MFFWGSCPGTFTMITEKQIPSTGHPSISNISPYSHLYIILYFRLIIPIFRLPCGSKLAQHLSP